MQKTITSLDGTRICYDIKRTASPGFLVFVHGAGGDFTAWRRERGFFHRKGIPTLAIDLRGHGKSGRPTAPKDYRLKRFAEDVYAVLTREKIKDFIIVGHCFGGMVTMMFHKLHPSLSRSYILVDTSCKAPTLLKDAFTHHQRIKRLIQALLSAMPTRKTKSSHADFREFTNTGDLSPRRMLSDILHTGFRSWFYTYESMAGFNGISILKGIKKRVLIMVGEEDSIFDVLKAKKISKLVRHSELDIIPNANHIIVLNNPIALEKEIFRFISGFKGFIHVPARPLDKGTQQLNTG